MHCAVTHATQPHPPPHVHPPCISSACLGQLDHWHMASHGPDQSQPRHSQPRQEDRRRAEVFVAKGLRRRVNKAKAAKPLPCTPSSSGAARRTTEIARCQVQCCCVLRWFRLVFGVLNPSLRWVQTCWKATAFQEHSSSSNKNSLKPSTRTRTGLLVHPAGPARRRRCVCTYVGFFSVFREPPRPALDACTP